MSINYLERSGKPRLAYKKLAAGAQGRDLPCVVFCAGFRSDMEGTKALYIEDRCRERGQACVRFDYSGHGASEGEFTDGTIGAWLEDTLAVIDEAAEKKPVVAVGSSMGGWLALLAGLKRPEQVKGVVGIAAAPDFTRDIYREQFDDGLRAQMEAQGYIDVPSEYSPEPYRITKALIEEGEAHCLLDGEIALAAPVRLIQGMQDSDVPWQKAYRIRNALADPALAEVLLVESGDHRLSRPEDLELIGRCIGELSGTG